MESRSVSLFRGRGEGVRRHGRDHESGAEEEEMELRRAGSRTGKCSSKAWLLVCVVASTLFCFYALICTSYPSGSGPDSATADEDEVDRQHLDKISIALLKLGLPLSAYALSAQQGYSVPPMGAKEPAASSEIDRNQSEKLGDGVERYTPERRADNAVELDTQSSETDMSRSEVSIYSVASNFNQKQQLWVFRNVCYNGSHMIRLQNEACREPEDAAPDSPLTPIHCRNRDLYSRRLAMVKETGISMAKRSPSWINERMSITWKNRTVSVVNLDLRTVDAGHFIQKVNMLLLLNNASTPAFQDQVDAFMFMTDSHIQKILMKGAGEEERFHQTYLSAILATGPHMDGKIGVDNVAGSLFDDGRIELGDSFSAATEERPVCFRKAVLAGTLKGSYWPGGEVVADMFRDQLSERFGASSTTRLSKEWPYLLCMLGDKTKENLSPASETSFRALLSKKSLGLDVHIKDFMAMGFKKQFSALQKADIVLGFYGSSVVFPAMFAPKMSVLIEIVPFKVLDRVHETQALDSGLVYMAHQCEEGSSLEDDFLFQNLTASVCMTNSHCRNYFAAVRQVELTKNDLSQLQKLLSLSRLIISEMSAQLFTQSMSDLAENLIGGRGKCKPFLHTENPAAKCGSNWVSFTSNSQGPMTCCY